MDCLAFAQGRCRSCTLLDVGHSQQVAAKQADAVAQLGLALGADAVAGIDWLPAFAGAESGFRTRAKMVVAGLVDSPKLGILDSGNVGVDLRDCPLHDPRLVAALPVLAEFVSLARLTPYDVNARKGELKHLITTVSPDSELMVRFVLRSTESLARIKKHLPWLEGKLPGLLVASANILAEHKAVLEGEQELLLTEREWLPMKLGAVTMLLGPQAFFQTNTEVATALYGHVREWVDAKAPESVWDLYCGVGGFALHCAAPGRQVTGVESSERAIAAAVESARLMAQAGSPESTDAAAPAAPPAAPAATFVAADAVAWAVGRQTPDLVIVNPPRRGIGRELASWLESSPVETVIYSSCNPRSLAADLAAMPSLRPKRGRVFDMFPHTAHVEVAVELERTTQ